MSSYNNFSKTINQLPSDSNYCYTGSTDNELSNKDFAFYGTNQVSNFIAPLLSGETLIAALEKRIIHSDFVLLFDTDLHNSNDLKLTLIKLQKNNSYIFNKDCLQLSKINIPLSFDFHCLQNNGSKITSQEVCYLSQKCHISIHLCHILLKVSLRLMQVICHHNTSVNFSLRAINFHRTTLEIL